MISRVAVAPFGKGAVHFAWMIDRKKTKNKKKEREDIVRNVNEGFRIHPWLANLAIVLFVLMASATFINQTICIFQNLGWMAKPRDLELGGAKKS